MEYYSALKNQGILAHATIWMKLEGTMLSEISQPQKDKSYVITRVYEMPQVIKPIETEGRMMVARGWGGKETGSYCLMGKGFSSER